MVRHPKPIDRLLRAVRLVGDLAAVAAALYGSFLVRMRVPLPFTASLLPSDRLTMAAAEGGLLFALTTQALLLYLFGFYDRPAEPRPRLDLARRLLTAVGLEGLLLASYYFLRDITFPRSVLVVFLIADLALLLVWRSLLGRLRPPDRRRVALVGCGAAAREVAETIHRHRWHGLEIAGFVVPPDEASPDDPDPSLGPPLGGIDDLPELVRDGRIDDVIVASSAPSWRTRLVDRLASVRPAGADVLLLPGPFDSLLGRMRYRWVHDLPLIEVINHSEWRLNRPLKRLFDLALGSLLVLPGLPLMAACAAAVRLTSPGPVLYRQVRVGRAGEPFTLLKFRTMRQDAEAGGGEVLSRPGDPRLTRLGGFLRRYRLDELPQLFNVLAGTMSLVGPRPERPGFVASYVESIPGYTERFAVAPGLTGLAQVNGEYLSSPQNKLRYDLAYVANWSLWLDLSILFRTVKSVLNSEGT